MQPNSSNNKKALVFSQKNCTGCDTVKSLLALKGYLVEEFELGRNATVQDLYELFPGVRTVPQVVIDGKAIGGLEAVKKYFE